MTNLAKTGLGRRDRQRRALPLPQNPDKRRSPCGGNEPSLPLFNGQLIGATILDITQLILDDHAEFRRLFAQIDEIEPTETATLGAVWNRLAAMLDAHAEAEERFFYPTLLKIGSGAADADDAKDETKDAIKDHNEIRDAVAKVAKHTPGSKAWIDAVAKANEANGDHLAEEERQGLSDFRQHADRDLSHALALKFARFKAEHLTGVPPVDKDPDKYIKAHEKA
jgi:hypothetical protein